MTNFGEITIEKKAREILMSREIVQEILRIGTSQEQILRIIYLLALELEDNTQMTNLTDVVKQHLTTLTSDEDKEKKSEIVLK